MMTYIEVHTTDPAFNLALEEYVFTKMPQDREYFLTWRNDNAIIIGRHQNTRAEINGDFVQEKNIRVVRRLSGGGAVYHDLGNLNFTFITDAKPGQKVDLRKFCQPVADALCSLGVDAVVDGRNDILVDGEKVCGSTTYNKNGIFLFISYYSFNDKSELIKIICRKLSAKTPGYIDFMTREELKRIQQQRLYMKK